MNILTIPAYFSPSQHSEWNELFSGRQGIELLLHTKGDEDDDVVEKGERIDNLPGDTVFLQYSGLSDDRYSKRIYPTSIQ